MKTADIIHLFAGSEIDRNQFATNIPYNISENVSFILSSVDTIGGHWKVASVIPWKAGDKVEAQHIVLLIHTPW